MKLQDLQVTGMMFTTRLHNGYKFQEKVADFMTKFGQDVETTPFMEWCV